MFLFFFLTSSVKVTVPFRATMARLLRKNSVIVVYSSLQSSPWIQQGFLISAGSPSTPAPPSHCLHSVPWTFVHQSVGAEMPVPHLAPEVSSQRPLYPESSRDTSAGTPKKYPHVSLLTRINTLTDCDGCCNILKLAFAAFWWRFLVNKVINLNGGNWDFWRSLNAFHLSSRKLRQFWLTGGGVQACRGGTATSHQSVRTGEASQLQKLQKD